MSLCTPFEVPSSRKTPVSKMEKSHRLLQTEACLRRPHLSYFTSKCRLEDSPPAGASDRVEPDSNLAPEPEKPMPQKQNQKVLFGVRAKPLKVVHKKKTTIPEQASPENGHVQAALPGAANGSQSQANSNRDGGGGALLGLGSYGTDSD